VELLHKLNTDLGDQEDLPGDLVQVEEDQEDLGRGVLEDLEVVAQGGLALEVVLVDLAVEEQEEQVDLVEVAQVALDQLVMHQEHQDHWKKQFLESLGMIIQFLLKFQRLLFCVMVKLMEDIMPILKLSAKLSTSVLMMGMVVSPSTASYALTGPYSSSNTLSVTGGSMLTVPSPNSFIH